MLWRCRDTSGHRSGGICTRPLIGHADNGLPYREMKRRRRREPSPSRLPFSCARVINRYPPLGSDTPREMIGELFLQTTVHSGIYLENEKLNARDRLLFSWEEFLWLGRPEVGFCELFPEKPVKISARDLGRAIYHWFKYKQIIFLVRESREIPWFFVLSAGRFFNRERFPGVGYNWILRMFCRESSD